MLTDTTKTHEIRIIGVQLGGKSCGLTFLVVGGGGQYGASTKYSGAGSGYLQYGYFEYGPGTVLTADVGDQGESSNLTFSNGGAIIIAFPGQSGQDRDGGAGYSGGGGEGSSYAGDGGSDGGDGEDGSTGVGGKGTGEDISSIAFTTWTLAPGHGGQQRSYNGGGGGGITVDGAAPGRPSDQVGQGYGGGGSGDSSYGDGMPGVILLEFN